MSWTEEIITLAQDVPVVIVTSQRANKYISIINQGGEDLKVSLTEAGTDTGETVASGGGKFVIEVANDSTTVPLELWAECTAAAGTDVRVFYN